jgi:hypothetical protein
MIWSDALGLACFGVVGCYVAFGVGCANFQPEACRFVDGDVSPNGWCQLFGPKPKS